MTDRTANIDRKTKETEIEIALRLDGAGKADIETGIGFLDHLLESLTHHARVDLRLRCRSDLHVDDHHSTEDCGLALGQALDEALVDRRGIRRFGFAYAPLDEALARAVIDLSGRPYAAVDLGLRRDMIGTLACENIGHLLTSLALAAKITLHVDVLKGANDHHRAEAAFKATALALREAVGASGFSDVSSTKGALTEDAVSRREPAYAPDAPSASRVRASLRESGS